MHLQWQPSRLSSNPTIILSLTCIQFATVRPPQLGTNFTIDARQAQQNGSAVAPLSQPKPNDGVQPFHEFLVRWSEADVSATAYELFHAGSDEPEHEFLAAQLRVVAQRWEKGLHLEIRHMQLRMPRPQV